MPFHLLFFEETSEAVTPATTDANRHLVMTLMLFSVITAYFCPSPLPSFIRAAPRGAVIENLGMGLAFIGSLGSTLFVSFDWAALSAPSSAHPQGRMGSMIVAPITDRMTVSEKIING